MVNVRILFLMLSVVTTFNHNDVSAANPNNQIEYLLEKIIQKVDLLEKNMKEEIENVDTVVSKVGWKVDDIEMKMAKQGGSNCMLFVDDKSFVFVVRIYVSS